MARKYTSSRLPAHAARPCWGARQQIPCNGDLMRNLQPERPATVRAARAAIIAKQLVSAEGRGCKPVQRDRDPHMERHS